MPEKHITIYDRITPPVKKKVPKSIRKDIDRIIKETWKKNMHKDYYDCNMLKEDSMKCCFYYHLRRKLSTTLKKYNLRIFTEYYVSELRYRADIAIVQLDDDCSYGFLGDHVQDIIAIFVLLFHNTATHDVEAAIRADITKIKNYIKTMDNGCQYYFTVIYEVECDKLFWMDGRSTTNWAVDRVTELVAGRMDGTTYFNVYSYNNMNKGLNTLY